MKQAIPAAVTARTVVLDPEAESLLVNLSKVTGQTPEATLARLVRDILVEDADAHGELQTRH